MPSTQILVLTKDHQATERSLRKKIDQGVEELEDSGEKMHETCSANTVWYILIDLLIAHKYLPRRHTVEKEERSLVSFSVGDKLVLFYSNDTRIFSSHEVSFPRLLNTYYRINIVGVF